MSNFTATHGRNVARRQSPARWGVLVFAALSVGGCASATSSISSLPKELGGLPDGTPARPASQLEYPAVHDMPPPRATVVLTPEQVKEAEAELTAMRDRQPGGAAPARKDRKKQEN